MVSTCVNTETGENYIFITKFVPYDKYHGFYEYLVIGKSDTVQRHIQKEYHPCGYGTHFECIHTEEDKIVYKGNRAESCD